MRLWLPGRFPSLNDGFELARETGYLAAWAKAKGLKVRTRDKFNERAQQIKAHVFAVARRDGWRGWHEAWAPTVDVVFWAHTRWDADAGGWAAKLIVDGLFGHFADRVVLEVRPRVRRDDSAPLRVFHRVPDLEPGQPGALVEVA